MYVFCYTCMYVCMYVCTGVRYVCIYVLMCVCMYLLPGWTSYGLCLGWPDCYVRHVHTYDIDTQIHRYVAQIDTCIHTYIHTYIHTDTYWCIHTGTYIHAYIHTCMHNDPSKVTNMLTTNTKYPYMYIHTCTYRHELHMCNWIEDLHQESPGNLRSSIHKVKNHVKNTLRKLTEISQIHLRKGHMYQYLASDWIEDLHQESPGNLRSSIFDP